MTDIEKLILSNQQYSLTCLAVVIKMINNMNGRKYVNTDIQKFCEEIVSNADSIRKILDEDK